jgi:DNA modification methylase
MELWQKRVNHQETRQLTSRLKKARFFARCSDGKDLSLGKIMNKTINGDTFEIMAEMPKKFVDLLIADPPYNLSIDYNGGKFKKMKENDYAEYTEKRLKLVMPLLKDEASIYICCDWKTSVIIGNILPKYLNVRNRITWQREKRAWSKRKLEKFDGRYLVCHK